jgi:arsenite/tail-anchored protein-transporting ATPase
LKADISGKSDRPPRFHFVGGKGGVGKTTCAAAFALREASCHRVLVASTDPAPSLADAFRTRLGREPARVAPKLDGVEIDAPPALRRWISSRRSSLEKIALQGTWLDRDDVNRLLSLSLPGIDEVAALLELSRLSRLGCYDLIVVDTAPTGHTLRMLSMPETLAGIARVFDSMREKHRVMVEALRGTFTPDAEDALVEEVATEARVLAELLRDRQRTRISWVTLPEPMAIAETLGALAELEHRDLAVREIIVNQLTPKRRARCAHCDARRAFEARAVRRIPHRSTMHVLAADEEPRGIAALKGIAKQLEPAPTVVGSRTTVLRYRSPVSPVAPDGSPASVPDSVKLLLFGGKGGVGKTTCAAATAVEMASRHRSRRVLLISTDPAHSLGDALGVKLSDAETPIGGTAMRLAARELDASRVFDDVRRKYASAIDRLFDCVGAGGAFDAAYDRSVLQGLIDLAPPGLDELAAIIEIADAMSADRPRWDLAVIDTAPTGHALRLLELPSLIHDWTKALMSILLKYQSVTGLGEVGELLLKISRGLGTLRKMLVDPSRTHVVVVTRAAALPRVETQRFVKRLDALHIHVPTVVVNAVGRGTCAVCRTIAGIEQREILRLRRSIVRPARQIVLAATEIPPPHGIAALRAWRRTGWRAVAERRALSSTH